MAPGAMIAPVHVYQAYEVAPWDQMSAAAVSDPQPWDPNNIPPSPREAHDGKDGAIPRPIPVTVTQLQALLSKLSLSGVLGPVHVLPSAEDVWTVIVGEMVSIAQLEMGSGLVVPAPGSIIRQ